MPAIRSTVLIGLLAAAGACGDDGGTTDAGCVGHGCNGGSVNINDNDGGNVLFEKVYLDTELQGALGLPTDTFNRAMAYFVSDMTNDHPKTPVIGSCVDIYADMAWPVFSAGAVHPDVGALTFTGKNEAGTDVTVTPVKKTAARDTINRMHDVFYEIITPDATTIVQDNSHYDMHFSGGADIPATDFTGKNGVYMPPDFMIGSPAREDNGPIGPGDYTVTWSNPTPPETGETLLHVSWFLAVPTAEPLYLCVSDTDGTFTFPAATIAAYKARATANGTAANKVILSRMTVAHHFTQLPVADFATNKRRVDVLGINCWVQLMDIQ
jgi:hypothetical protein